MTTVEIWSDILCPFCYIGKRRFQAALAAFPQRDKVEVIWRSFELNPDAKRDSQKNIYEHLAEKYGRTVEWAREQNANLARQGTPLGLNFDFDHLIPTNSFDAHRLLHFAKSKGRQDAVSEKLFAAYFTEGKHIGRIETLLVLAVDAGLDAKETEAVLRSDAFTEAVRADEDEAQLFGLTGVPAFVCNRKYLISGAQAEAVFTQALEKLVEDA